MGEPSKLAARRGELRLDDGTTLVVRPLVPDDEPLLVEGFEHLSPESRYHRFFSPLTQLGPQLLVQLTDLDYHDRFAWIALVREDDHEVPVAVARYFVMMNTPSSVEIAITVVDEYQGRGVGTLLVQLLARTAVANGFERLEGQVLAENAPMRALLSALGAHTSAAERGVIDFDVDLGALPSLGTTANDGVIGSLACSAA